MNSVIPKNFVCFELAVDSQSYLSPAWHSNEAVVEQATSLDIGLEKS